jgi:hypothetical protein
VDLVDKPATPAQPPAASRAPKHSIAQKPISPVISVLFILVFPALVFAGLVALSTRDASRRTRLGA